jgi:hypothetical protein
LTDFTFIVVTSQVAATLWLRRKGVPKSSRLSPRRAGHVRQMTKFHMFLRDRFGT